MAKKHIVSVGYMKFGYDSIKAATDLVAILSKGALLEYDYDHPNRGYKPAGEDRVRDIELILNQEFHTPLKAKEEKPLGLPAPKRGSILCICEKSHVAPRQTCPHCGRSFSESHNRTHQDQPIAKQPTLRLV